MTSAKICDLVRALPAQSPYFGRAFGDQSTPRPRPLVERLQVALNDPALIGNLAQIYALAELPLPPFGLPAATYRAHAHFLTPQLRQDDQELRLAIDLQRPEFWLEREVIRALLWCPSATNEKIAQLFQLTPAVIDLFEVLYWNCRDRYGEALYFAQILHRARGSRLKRERDFGVDLLRVACQTSSIPAVLQAADLGVTAGPTTQVELEGQLVKLLVSLAATGHPTALDLVEAYGQQPAHPETTDLAILISRNPQCQKEVQSMVTASIRDHLQAQNARATTSEGSHKDGHPGEASLAGMVGANQEAPGIEPAGSADQGNPKPPTSP